jgi:hypothetical protein
MKEISIDYKWWKFTRKFKRQLPERWEELTAQQLIAVAHLSIGDINDNEFFRMMCDIPGKIARKLDSFQKWAIGQQLLFTSVYEPWYRFILKLNGLQAPGPRLEGMTFGHFMFVDTFYSDWVNMQAKEDERFDSAQRDKELCKFVGSLYLPAGEKFDTQKLSVYIENAEDLQEAERIAITLNYRLLKEWLTNLYPMVFERPEEDTEEPKKRKLPAGKQTGGWLNIFESIVGDDLIHQEQYFELPAHTVLRFMSKKIKENAKR